MYVQHRARRSLARVLPVALAVLLVSATAWAQDSIVKKLEAPSERLELTVNTSRVLTLDQNIPRVQVNNPAVLAVTPLSKNQVQISAKKPGVTDVNLWGEDDQIYSVHVVVYGDVRELKMALQDQFPNASVEVHRYSSSLVLSGFVDQPSHISPIVRLAEDYAPKIINNISVGGVQKILLNVQVMEVSRTKLRQLGFDFGVMNNANDFVTGSVSGLISAISDSGSVSSAAGDTLRFGIVENSSFFGFLKALRQHQLAKVLAEPKIVAVSGRPASFNVGGEIPIPSSQGLGSTAIKWKKYGTQVEFVPLVLGNGNIRLEVRPRVSELDSTRTYVNGIPGLLVREVDTAVEMKAGQTLALAGLVQTRVESVNKGLPVLADIPFLGAAFRSVEYKNNEVELLILVRPEFIDPLDPHEVPPGGPGTNTCHPSDHQLYWKGFLEVPCKDGCPPGGVAPPPGLMGLPEMAPAPPSDIPPGVLPPGAIPVTPPETIQPAAPAAPPVSLPSIRDEVSVSIPAARRPVIPRATGNYRRDSEAPPGLIGPIGYDNLK